MVREETRARAHWRADTAIGLEDCALLQTNGWSWVKEQMSEVRGSKGWSRLQLVSVRNDSGSSSIYSGLCYICLYLHPMHLHQKEWKHVGRSVAL